MEKLLSISSIRDNGESTKKTTTQKVEFIPIGPLKNLGGTIFKSATFYSDRGAKIRDVPESENYLTSLGTATCYFRVFIDEPVFKKLEKTIFDSLKIQNLSGYIPTVYHNERGYAEIGVSGYNSSANDVVRDHLEKLAEKIKLERDILSLKSR